MRVTIDKVSEFHPGKVFDLTDWFCEKENITYKEALIEHETPKAYSMRFTDGVQQWVPKSLCKEIKIEATTLEGYV